MMLGFGVNARLAPESHANGAKHVKSGEAGRESRQPIHPVVAEWTFVGSLQDYVLAEEAGEPGEAANGQRSDKEGCMSDLQLVVQAAHLSHVQFAAHGVHHAARRQKEQGLEKGMRHQVKDASGKQAHSATNEHVTELADG